MAKILLLGGTGAMGVYLAPELIYQGHNVFVTSRSIRKSDNDKLVYIKGNAHDETFLIDTFTQNKFDAIIDFMAYNTEEFRKRHKLLLSNTTHYIFLSTYRVFAESNVPITEVSPRLLDVSKDQKYLATDEYALTKARQENILRASQYKNWTIVRPTITYSKKRFQLGTLEADTIIVRALAKCPVILPSEMLCRQTTMTWGGDVARMIARLTLNNTAFCEDFNVCTAEHHSWEEVGGYYKELIGLSIVPTDINTYLSVVGKEGVNYQVVYDRMFDRVMDNSKILNLVGMQQKEFMSLFDGLNKELSNKESLKSIKMNYTINRKMDRITNTSMPQTLYLVSWVEKVLGKVKRALIKISCN